MSIRKKTTPRPIVRKLPSALSNSYFLSILNEKNDILSRAVRGAVLHDPIKIMIGGICE
jgi:hypothetical protein